MIYDFGQTSEKYVAARDAAEAQRYEEQVTRLNIVSTVRQAYFTARANKELVDVAQETLDNQQKHLVQVQAFVQVGTQPEIALAQQKAAVANAKVQLIASQNNYDTAKAQLNQAAGLVGGTEYDVTDEQEPPVDDEDQPLETLVEKAFAARPELANLWKQEDAQHATIRSAKGGYGPALTRHRRRERIGDLAERAEPELERRRHADVAALPGRPHARDRAPGRGEPRRASRRRATSRGSRSSSASTPRSSACAPRRRPSAPPTRR